jgi:sec-independent protein translocase protein TatA
MNIIKQGEAMFGLGMPELIVILIIVILVFGAGRISEIGGAIGKGIKSFKKAINEPEEIDVTPTPSKDEKEKKKEEPK